MPRLRAPITAAFIAGALAAGVAVTALSQDAPAAWPDVTGTWVGETRVAAIGETVMEYTETVVIERQDAELVWGKVVWTDAAGAPLESPVLGTIRSDRTTLVLSEETSLWTATVDGDTMEALLVFNNGGDDHGAVEVVLERQ